jgi:hypothetical protein
MKDQIHTQKFYRRGNWIDIAHIEQNIYSFVIFQGICMYVSHKF